MPNKTVPLSVRVSPEDALFLAGFEIDDAVTPSEKLRALLHETQRRQAGFEDAAEGEMLLREMATPARRRLRRLEAGNGQKSDVVLKLYERVPEIMAMLIAGPNNDDEKAEPDGEKKAESLSAFEADLTEELATLCRDFILIGLSSPARVYDEENYRTELKPVVELIEIVRQHDVTKKGNTDE